MYPPEVAVVEQVGQGGIREKTEYALWDLLTISMVFFALSAMDTSKDSCAQSLRAICSTRAVMTLIQMGGLKHNPTPNHTTGEHELMC